MSSKTKSVALNLGMQTVAMAEFEFLPGGGLALSGYEENELMVDPAADITRGEQIKFSVQEMRKALKLRKGVAVSQCLPSQAVFTRFVRLPGSSPEDVRAVIGFEAQQNVPFPIDEVVWDYQLLGMEREGSWDVALVAIKSDQLNEVCEACEHGGVSPGAVDVAPMALYNAYRYNYSDVSGVSLLIDMGARTTNLIFIDGDKIFSRTIPIGGNTITLNLAKELTQEIAAAEVLKKDKGFVALGGAYADASDPTVAKISKLARNTMTRLHAEIARSISFYRANQGGSQPVRAYLCGGSMSMPYMLEFFAEKLQMPVEVFNPLRNVTVASEEVAEAVSGKIHTLGELVGLGLRGMGGCPVEISLQPPKSKRKTQLAKRQPALIAAVIVLALGLLSLQFYFSRAGEIFSQVTQLVQADINRLSGVSSQISETRNETARIQALAAPILLAIEERAFWLHLIDTLGTKLPDRYIWITQFTPVSNGTPVSLDAIGTAPAARPAGGPAVPGQRRAAESEARVIDAIRIEGLYLDNPAMATVVDNFVNSLAQSDLFVIDSSVRSSMERTTPDGSSWAYRYSVVVPLKTPIAY